MAIFEHFSARIIHLLFKDSQTTSFCPSHFFKPVRSVALSTYKLHLPITISILELHFLIAPFVLVLRFLCSNIITALVNNLLLLFLLSLCPIGVITFTFSVYSYCHSIIVADAAVTVTIIITIVIIAAVIFSPYL